MMHSPAFWAVVGYLLGSIPFGLLLTRAFGAGDLRAIGSGNIGATNVLRTGHKGLALATLLLDGGKGAAAVLLARHFSGDGLLDTNTLIAGFAAFGGHLYPIWLRLRGGKGVATMLGVTLAVHWPVGIAALVIWLIGAGVTRYSSVGGMLAALVMPVVLTWGVVTNQWTLMFSQTVAWLIVFWIMAGLLILKHADNIRRLRAGTESRIGSK